MEKDGQVRKDVSEGVEVVNDESIELEDEEDSANLLQQPSLPPAFFYNSYAEFYTAITLFHSFF